MRLDDVPPRYRKLHQRATKGRSPLVAIRAHCAMCCGWEDLPEAIAECASPSCPLFRFRLGKRPPQTQREVSPAPRINAAGRDRPEEPPDVPAAPGGRQPPPSRFFPTPLRARTPSYVVK